MSSTLGWVASFFCPSLPCPQQILTPCDDVVDFRRLWKHALGAILFVHSDDLRARLPVEDRFFSPYWPDCGAPPSHIVPIGEGWWMNADVAIGFGTDILCGVAASLLFVFGSRWVLFGVSGTKRTLQSCFQLKNDDDASSAVLLSQHGLLLTTGVVVNKQRWITITRNDFTVKGYVNWKVLAVDDDNDLALCSFKPTPWRFLPQDEAPRLLPLEYSLKDARKMYAVTYPGACCEAVRSPMVWKDEPPHTSQELAAKGMSGGGIYVHSPQHGTCLCGIVREGEKGHVFARDVRKFLAVHMPTEWKNKIWSESRFQTVLMLSYVVIFCCASRFFAQYCVDTRVFLRADPSFKQYADWPAALFFSWILPILIGTVYCVRSQSFIWRLYTSVTDEDALRFRIEAAKFARQRDEVKSEPSMDTIRAVAY